MNTDRVNKIALLKSVSIASIFTTLFMSLLSGYGFNISPDGDTSHYYSFTQVKTYLIILLIIMAPTIAILGYTLGYLIIRYRLFKLTYVLMIGFLSASIFASLLFFDLTVIFSFLGLYYLLPGVIAAYLSYYLYKKFNNKLQPTATSAAG